MSELIDRQAFRAAHGLGSDCHDCKRDMKSCQYDRDYSLMDFCEWLDDAPTASPWHRVEEELPKEDGKYLVYMFTSAWRWEFKFAGYLHGRWIGADGGDVRYWMPIEPPKEEE